jgi:hypothetical protein
VVRIHSPHPEIYRREERAETSSNVVTFTDFQPVITALQTQISVSTIVAVLAAVAGISVGLVFMWWAGRKGVRALMAAFKKGKLSL